jgi:hypothetical protein
MNQTYLIYQAERTMTRQERRAADTSAGEFARAFAELRTSLRRGIPVLRRASGSAATNVDDLGDGAGVTTRTFEMI